MKFLATLKCKTLVFTIALLFPVLVFCQTKTWVGAGAGGVGTDFNTNSNWSPAGVPTAVNDVVITITSDAVINLSANASIKSLTYTANANNANAELYVGGNTLTISGTSEIRVSGGNNNTDIIFGVNGGTSAGIIDFGGDVTLATAGSTTGGGSGLVGNVNSKMIFRGNLTFNIEAFIGTASFKPGTFEFDGTGSQTITWNNTGFYCEMNNVIIGNINNPIVNQITGIIAPDNILGSLTTNGSSVLNLGTSIWNGGTSGGGTGNAGTLTLNGTSTLQLGAATGGQGGSNFPIRFTTLSIAPTSTVEYTGTVAQTIYDIPSPGYGNLTVTNNSTKSPTSGLDIRSNLLINSTATFSAGTGMLHSIGGNWTNNNVFTAGTSTINLNGSALQSISGTNNTTFYSLTANNTAGLSTTGITLQRPTTVTNTLTLTNGLITTDATNLLIMDAGSNVATSNYFLRNSGGSANSFINGPMRKIGNTNFLFPVGKINRGIRFCGISAPSIATDAFTAEFIANSASNLPGGITTSTISHVSKCEYWDIARTSGGSTVSVTLSWNTQSMCNPIAYVTDPTSLKIAHYGTSWDNSGGTMDGGSLPSAGSITWAGVTTFSPFSLASTNSENPLPVKLVDVKAYNISGNNRIEWTNLTETDVVAYEVERSLNGTQFSLMTTLAARSNANGKESYYEYDVQPTQVTYYRIKVTSRDGKIIYSPIVKVAMNLTVKQDIVLYPNPVTGKQFTLQMHAAAGDYFVKIFGSNGQIVKTEILKHPGGSYSKTIDLPGQLQAGQYYMQVSGGEKILTSKFIVQ